MEVVLHSEMSSDVSPSDAVQQHRIELSPEDISALEALQAHFSFIEEQMISVSHDALGERWRTALETYHRSPEIPSAFEELKRSRLELDFFRSDTRVRMQCRDALTRFTKDQVLPLARRIIHKHIAPAADVAVKVRAVENARCMRLTGRPIVHSDIVSAAELPVKQLEALRVRLDLNIMPSALSPQRVVELLSAVGTLGFNMSDLELAPAEIEAAIAEDFAVRQAAEETVEESPVFS